MKRIAIPMITLMAGGILVAQITPQAAQTVQSQARTATKSAQSSPASSSPANSSTAAAVKPVPSTKTSTTAATKPTAQSAAPAKPSAIAPVAGKSVTSAAQSKKAPVPASPIKVTPAIATVKTTAPKRAIPKPAVQKAVKAEQPKLKEAMVKTESPAPEPKPVINLASRRDPFTSPVTRALAVNQGPGCSTGKRCLAVDQMILRGIVRSPNGMIAVVENGAKRAYFLRENDPVWHGMVEKINGDSVVFREESVDTKTGKSSTHEVVKRVNAPVV